MLYIVPTPLGHLQDVTTRSLETLRRVRAIYCEDTRRTRKLTTHYAIATPLVRYEEHAERCARSALERLRRGEDLALVSDSGTPALSDPGRRLVALARQNGVPVTSLPGPSAVAAALAGSGLPGDSFVFLGFLQRAPARRRRALSQALSLGRTIVVYESPHRVLAALEDARAVLGGEAQACVVRELSKIHEEWLNGSISRVHETLRSRPELLGEFVLLFHPRPMTEGREP